MKNFFFLVVLIILFCDKLFSQKPDTLIININEHVNLNIYSADLFVENDYFCIDSLYYNFFTSSQKIINKLDTTKYYTIVCSTQQNQIIDINIKETIPVACEIIQQNENIFFINQHRFNIFFLSTDINYDIINVQLASTKYLIEMTNISLHALYQEAVEDIEIKNRSDLKIVKAIYKKDVTSNFLLTESAFIKETDMNNNIYVEYVMGAALITNQLASKIGFNIQYRYFKKNYLSHNFGFSNCSYILPNTLFFSGNHLIMCFDLFYKTIQMNSAYSLKFNLGYSFFTMSPFKEDKIFNYGCELGIKNFSVQFTMFIKKFNNANSTFIGEPSLSFNFIF